MQVFKKEWLPIVMEQESLLRFEKFEQNDAWKIGKSVVELMATKYKAIGEGVGIRIILNHVVVFSLLQNTATVNNNWWIDKKLNVAYKTNCCPLRAGLEFKFGVREDEEWIHQEDNYAACGGCMPIWLKDGSIVGYAALSNLPHEYDHQLLADAMAAVLGVKIPSII